MAGRTLSLEELRNQPLDLLLEEVAEGGEPVTIRLPGGQEILIIGKPRLKPLPLLEGSVPMGWKDAFYAPDLG